MTVTGVFDANFKVSVARTIKAVRPTIGSREMTQKWKRRSPGLNWGEFGLDD